MCVCITQILDVIKSCEFLICDYRNKALCILHVCKMLAWLLLQKENCIGQFAFLEGTNLSLLPVPKTEEMSRRLGNLVEEFKQLVYPPDYNPEGKAAKRKQGK